MPDAKDNALSADPVALLAELERVHGPEVAAVAFRTITGQDPPRRRKPPPRTVGAKAQVPRIGLLRLLAETKAGRGVNWREITARDPDDEKVGSILAFRDDYRGPRNRSGLPRSGAPRAPSSR